MTIVISRILFPTDFSEPAREALQHTVAFADRFGAELHLVHIVAPMMPFPDATSSWVSPDTNQYLQIEAAEERLAMERQAQWSEQLRIVRFTAIGFAVDEILKYAREKAIDLIVIGTHGNTGLSRLVIGSVAEKIVRLAKCPVLTVHPQGYPFLVAVTADRLAEAAS